MSEIVAGALVSALACLVVMLIGKLFTSGRGFMPYWYIATVTCFAAVAGALIALIG